MDKKNWPRMKNPEFFYLEKVSGIIRHKDTLENTIIFMLQQKLLSADESYPLYGKLIL